MRERVEVSGGRFTAGPRLGAGWQVDAKLPVSRQADKPAVLAGTKADVVIVDIRMPVMDGVEAIKRLSRLPDRPWV
ncbi:hypothetical protein [Streptomyces sp. NPDC002588]|uniref:hypothetical protein n=1 Tax=Streptomyces sp. NPDC002588 TaxID=3154419 RepID=UPI0033276C6B